MRSFVSGSSISIGTNNRFGNCEVISSLDAGSRQGDIIVITSDGGVTKFIVAGTEYEINKNARLRLQLTTDDGKTTAFIPYTDKLSVQTGSNCRVTVHSQSGDVSAKIGNESTVSINTMSGDIDVTATDSVVSKCNTMSGDIRVSKAKSVGPCSSMTGSVRKT